MKLHDPAYLMKYSAFAAGLAQAQHDEKQADGSTQEFSTARTLMEDPDAYIRSSKSTDPDFPEMVHDAAATLQMLPANTNWYFTDKAGSAVVGGAVSALQEQADTCSRMAAALIAGMPAAVAVNADRLPLPS